MGCDGDAITPGTEIVFYSYPELEVLGTAQIVHAEVCYQAVLCCRYPKVVTLPVRIAAQDAPAVTDHSMPSTVQGVCRLRWIRRLWVNGRC